MGIRKASNCERFVFDLVGRDAGALNALWRQVEREVRFDPSTSPLFGDVSQRFGFVASRAWHDDCIATIRDVDGLAGSSWTRHMAVEVVREHVVPGVPMVVLETAKRAFAETVRETLGRDNEMPARSVGPLDRPQKSPHLVADPAAV